MKIGFQWPPPEGSQWSEEAAHTLIGQTTSVDGIPGTVVNCQLKGDMFLEVTIELEESGERYDNLVSILENNQRRSNMLVAEGNHAESFSRMELVEALREAKTIKE